MATRERWVNGGVPGGILMSTSRDSQVEPPSSDQRNVPRYSPGSASCPPQAWSETSFGPPRRATPIVGVEADGSHVRPRSWETNDRPRSVTVCWPTLMLSATSPLGISSANGKFVSSSNWNTVSTPSTVTFQPPAGGAAPC